MKPKLQSKLSISKRQDPETPFILTFELTNKGNKDVHVLKYDTPLEGLFSDCFEVTRDGVEVPYDGPLVKRAAPTEDDYVCIKPGKTVTVDVDLSSSYQVSVPAEYKVRFRGDLPDVAHTKELNAKAKGVVPFALESAQATSRTTKFTVKSGTHGRATAGEAARHLEEIAPKPMAKVVKKKAVQANALVPVIVGGTAAKKTQAKNAHKAGYNLAVAALASLANDAHYKEWFGSHTAARLNKVKATYTSVKTRLENTTFTYDLTGTGCQSGWYAYTYKDATTIWFCGAFWNAPATGTDSKAGTVVHEHSHASGSTDDLAYGQSACRQLALNTPDSAIKNADCYEYYAGG